MMPGWLKGGMLIVLCCAASWGGAVGYWSSTNRMPSTADLALLLVALPLGLLVLFLVGRKAIAAFGAAPAAAAQTVAAPATAAAAAPSLPPLAILATSLRAPHGASAEALSAALAEQSARPELDPELVDDNGFPVMTARCHDAANPGLQADVEAWLEQNGMSGVQLNAEQWRAVAMGSAVVAELVAIAAGSLLPAEGAPPMLHLLPVLPPEWGLQQRRAAGLWLRYTLSQAGWPAAAISLAAELPSDARGASPSAVLKRLAHHGASAGGPLAAIVVACDSHVGEDSIGQWSDDRILFTSSRPQGAIPGEGACGMLLSDLQQATAGGAAIALLSPASEARLGSSADERKRADATLLGTLAEAALACAATEAGAVAMLAADTGHRTSRVLELMAASSKAFPQLDDSDILRAGASLGSCGAVPFMAALVLAHHHALEKGAPVLCISNEDPYRRCAVLVRPAAPLS